MKFCYCPECDRLRPKNWYSRERCNGCGGECIIYRESRSIYGSIMYLLDVIALVLVVLYVAYNDFNVQTVSFIGEVSVGMLFGVIFGLILVSFIFGYVDLSKTTEKVAMRARADRVDRKD